MGLGEGAGAEQRAHTGLHRAPWGPASSPQSAVHCLSTEPAHQLLAQRQVCGATSQQGPFCTHSSVRGRGGGKGRAPHQEAEMGELSTQHPPLHNGGPRF